MAEWSKATGCKPVSNTRVGSNPTLLKMLKTNKYLLYTNNLNLLSFFDKININNSKRIINNTQSTLNFSLTLKKSSLLLMTNTNFYIFLQTLIPVYIKTTNYIISLNFKRLRFFPNFKNLKGINFTNLSLGLLNSFFNKGKFFLKSKIVYLALTNFFRKLLLFSGIKFFYLHINRNPKFFLEILSTLINPVISLYTNPFNVQSKINELN